MCDWLEVMRRCGDDAVSPFVRIDMHQKVANQYCAHEYSNLLLESWHLPSLNYTF